MRNPKFVEYKTASEVWATEQLLEQAEGGQLVLRFSALSADESTTLIHRLSRELPDHAVFQSRFGTQDQWVTILPLVSKAKILERRDRIRQAMAAYAQTCAELIRQYQSDALASEWTVDDHGEHCRFVHSASGQTVEAPFHGLVRVNQIDPYFFAVFVKSTQGLEPVAELVTGNW
ncbi:hypothetical protein [Comamonas guangdongensis]|uniref:Uncharacterized protein n=1 Tax=Comamonas guangdongensis TaxID=510515 RepID=A0ABV4A074_9BURK